MIENQIRIMFNGNVDETVGGRHNKIGSRNQDSLDNSLLLWKMFYELS